MAVKQELTLQAGASASVDSSSLRLQWIHMKLFFLIWLDSISNPVRQTLQFVPTASFDRSSQKVAELVKKVEDLLKSTNWDQLAAARFVEVANELRRMDKSNIDSFKNSPGLK